MSDTIDNVDISSDLDVIGSDPSDSVETPVEDKTEETIEAKEDSTDDEVVTEEEIDEVIGEKKESEPEKLSSGLFTRPSVKAINEKFPGLFKEFPQIKEALFREREFNEHFDSIEEAKDAKGKAETFDLINNDVTSGNMEGFLSAVKDSAPKALNKVAENFLPHLYKVDEGLYFKAVKPLITSFIQGMYTDGKKSNNDNLSNAALLALEFAGFEESDLAGKNNQPSPDLKEKEENLTKKERELEGQRYQNALSAVSSRIETEIAGLISDLLKDEKGTDYQKKAMKRDITESLQSFMGKDKRNLDTMTQFWTKAQKAGFNKEWQDRIYNAYLSRAKAVLPAIRSKVRKEVFGDVVKTETKPREIKTTTAPKQTIPNGKKYKSDLDILNED